MLLRHKLGFVAVILATLLAAAYIAKVVAEDVPWHWAQSERNLLIEDRTGSPDWQAATQRAVNEWSVSGANISLIFTTQSTFNGYCGPYGTTISVCRHDLDTDKHRWRAVTWQQHSGDHFTDAWIEVNDQREGQWDFDTKTSIMCHELGHVLGLSESSDPNSCMTDSPSSFPPAPTAQDYSDLRAKYANAD